MDDDYWNSSSVTKKVSQQGIFDTDGNNTIDESILGSSRSTPPLSTAGVTSARYHSTTTTTNNSPITKKLVTNNTPIPTKTAPNIQPKNNIPTSQVSRPIDQSTECKQKLCI
ncbi:unnamed protein product [Rotaria sp. Silwood1]|nr:unnamed protein product [Rotaria sp. Silwood1]CAF1428206.1 unnamed protein product [Rotaria sp. Silwood1]CAF3565156.1 unnamed protein product [Rotaria sp. Silwood1]CAF3668189.1 unnamed protein product [Rotaria sp. Silwood1]